MYIHTYRWEAWKAWMHAAPSASSRPTRTRDAEGIGGRFLIVLHVTNYIMLIVRRVSCYTNSTNIDNHQDIREVPRRRGQRGPGIRRRWVYIYEEDLRETGVGVGVERDRRARAVGGGAGVGEERGEEEEEEEEEGRRGSPEPEGDAWIRPAG